MVQWRQHHAQRHDPAGGAHGLPFRIGLLSRLRKEALLDSTVITTTPITMFLGSDDEEVSPEICQHVAERSRVAARRSMRCCIPARRMISTTPAEKHQSVPGNVAAKADAMSRVIAIVNAAGH